MPLMTLRVYRVDRAGIVTQDGPLQEITSRDDLQPMATSQWPACACPRHRSTR